MFFLFEDPTTCAQNEEFSFQIRSEPEGFLLFFLQYIPPLIQAHKISLDPSTKKISKEFGGCRWKDRDPPPKVNNLSGKIVQESCTVSSFSILEES